MQVFFDSPFGETQLICNLLIGLGVANQIHDLLLAVREFLAIFRLPSRDFGFATPGANVFSAEGTKAATTTSAASRAGRKKL